MKFFQFDQFKFIKCLVTGLLLLFITTHTLANEMNEKSKNEANTAPSKPIIIVLLGAPGSGKGTQAKKLSDELKLTHISTGDLLRENVKNETALGNEAKGFMESGKLVPDNLVSKMLFSRLEEKNSTNGYILDGYPRTVAQAKELDAHLKNKATVVVINLQVEDEKLIERIVQRSQAKSSEKRSDDTPEVAKERLKIYHEQTVPVIKYYDGKGQLIQVDGDQKPREVFKEIMKAYKKETQKS